MLTKEFTLDVKAVADDGTFEGYASTFGGPPDSYGDIISPGAFAESLVKHRREGTMPLMLFGHAHNDLPLGNWTDLSEDGKGLFGRGAVDLEDPFGARVHRALKQKRVRGLSIGFETKKSHPDDKRPGVRFLDEIDLWEVSVVNFPANRRSLVQSVKTILDGGNVPTVREFEEFLRDAGFSKSLATAIAGKATPHLRGDPEAKANDVISFLEKLRA